MSDAARVRRALISVSDKTGVVELARGLHALGVTLVSTGGTAALLAGSALPVIEVADVTGIPEMLDGRVKTLHPKIHGGLLARRDVSSDIDALAAHAITPIDLLVVNLYPFRATVAKADCTFEEAVENIDIGGPAMLRAAAKNHRHVAVVVDPSDYAPVLAELRAHGAVSDATRLSLAAKGFLHTARYDGAVAEWFSSLRGTPRPADVPERDPYPSALALHFDRLQPMRYGENPHQSAAFYRDAEPPPGTLAHLVQLQGKELSYNNIADADAAWECVKTFDAPACVIVKHANPCGVAIGRDPLEAYTKALRTDATSAFGGIIAFNRPLDGVAATAIAKQFVEVLIAPSIDAHAREVFATKQNVRLLEVALPPAGANPSLRAWDLKRVGGGLLVQSPDDRNVAQHELRVVTRRVPTQSELDDLSFAWKVAKFVKSNAIVFCRDGATVGVGAGQMSRVDSARIAGIKAANAGLSLAGSAVASDAFFPFRDGIDVLADAGAGTVIQPGGSMRDSEVIAAADEHGLAMVFTGVRHFRH